MSYYRAMRSKQMLAVYPPWMALLCAISATGCAQWIGIEDLPEITDGPRASIDANSFDANPSMPDANVTLPDSGMIDAMVPPDARLRCQDWPAPRHFEPCGIPEPQGSLVLDQAGGDYVYDTDSASLRAPDGTPIGHATSILPGNPELRLISIEQLLIGANARLRVVGSRPFVVASWSEMVVNGEIDVSSSEASSGAGAGTGDCNAAETGGQDNQGGGGGGGGGFNGDGGDGGDGSDGEGGGGTGGTQVAVPETVRGGCRGEAGGVGDGGDGAGEGGGGGGALQLTARNGVTINGRLHAGGAGGRGAASDNGRRCGGGGGGSGGLIGLEAPMLSIGASAVIAANGGGGGEGVDSANGDAGDDGSPGASAGAGGIGNDSRGGDGGAGGARTNSDAGNGSNGISSGANYGGGGGGGGGAGYIILEGAATVDAAAVLSPAPEAR